MRRIIAGAAGAALAATALVGALPGAASATGSDVHAQKKVYSQKAKPTRKSTKFDAYCNTVSNGRKMAGMACFRAKGDRVWIKDTLKDGLRVEVRGTVNSGGQPGYRCYGNYKGGWQVCNFDRQMAEKHVFLWYVSTWKGNKIKWTSDEKMLRTS
ncbi:MULTISPECIES: hypothetical protein [Streptomyces]|uniref:Secreted protein n=1 Tax=Streptomyces siderophoricus TaxID=2802281 RepID=A0ABS1MXG4_9ACTN|nr:MULTISPECIES: hypothetical protein [unclassified Streptomyces]MBL1092483.1 hypothetical protein [Streptomyces sp. 9-7]